MRLSFKKLVFAVSLLSVVPLSASAGQILWTFDGATFSDGGSASGSFVFDPDLNQYSSVEITTTSGSALSGAAYDVVTTGLVPDAGEALFGTTTGDLTGTPGLALFYASELSDAGGSISISSSPGFGREGTCNDPTCSEPTDPGRIFSAGTIVGTVVTPEPSTVFLIGEALVSLAFIGRLRSHRS
jgi:hypothetical protein